jgi:uncharacterized membrane protein YidH (DUF202 family)
MSIQKPKSNRWSLRRNVRDIALMVSASLAFYYLVLWQPTTIAARGAALSLVVEIVSSMVPNIAKFSASSTMPAVAESFLAVVWILIAASAAIVLVRGKYPMDRQVGLPWRYNKWLILCVIVVIIVIVPIAAYYIGTSNFRPATTTVTDIFREIQWRALSSKRWLALYGALSYSQTVLGFAVAIGIVRNFRRLWLDNSDRNN